MSAGMTESKSRKVGIDGIRIDVLDVLIDGVSVWRDTDGFIPTLLGMHKEVKLLIDAGANFFGFSVDGKKNITPAKNYSNFTNTESKIYRKKIPIHIINGKEPYSTEIYTLYHENHIRLLEVSNDGHFAIYEVAVVFQNGFGFLTTQRVYGGAVFQSGKRLFCPEFDGKWPQLVTFMESIYKQNGNGIDNLPYFEGYNPFAKKADNINLDDDVGIVKWFNVTQGFGAISTNKGDVFVHYKDIESPKRLVCLDVGDMVLFEELIPNTSDQGGFSYKAVGVLAPGA